MGLRGQFIHHFLFFPPHIELKRCIIPFSEPFERLSLLDGGEERCPGLIGVLFGARHPSMLHRDPAAQAVAVCRGEKLPLRRNLRRSHFPDRGVTPLLLDEQVLKSRPFLIERLLRRHQSAFGDFFFMMPYIQHALQSEPESLHTRLSQPAARVFSRKQVVW
jgi:hypothetical protein